MKLKFKILFIAACLASSFYTVAQNPTKVDSLESALIQSQNPLEKINILIRLTDYLFTNNPDQSIEYATRALDLSKIHNYEEGRLLALIRIAEIYWGKTDLKPAMNYANRAKKLAIKISNKSGYAKALLIIGSVYTNLGEYEKSSELFFEALNIFEMENDKKGIEKALSRIGNVYFEQENYEKALKYNLQSLEIAREINDLVGISRGLNNVAATYGNMGEFENFEVNIRKAIELNKKNGRRLWEGINYFNLAIIYRDRKTYDTSLIYFNKAEAIFLELNYIPKLTQIYINYSKFYTQTNERDSSLYYAKKAYDLAKNNSLKRLIYEAAEQLHKIYIQENNLVNAYKYSTIEYQMKDSLDIEKSMTRLSQLELLYEFEKLNQEKKLQQQSKEYLYIISGTIIIFIFILIIILVVVRQRIKVKNTIILKKQLEGELEIKNKELTFNVMTLMRKNEILSEIADKLMKIQDKAVKEETKLAIKKIAADLQETSDKEIWDEFEVRFKQVHKDFYDKLNTQFPNLSPNEQRLCAFLRLNMTSKEISELTGQRTATLEIARTRLRKKLDITNTKENLVTFLSQI